MGGNKMKRIGNKIYGVCVDCGKIVRYNKPLFGSFHHCPYLIGTPEQIAHYRNVVIPRIKKEFDALN